MNTCQPAPGLGSHSLSMLHHPTGFSSGTLHSAGLSPPTLEFSLQRQKAAVDPPLCRNTEMEQRGSRVFFRTRVRLHIHSGAEPVDTGSLEGLDPGFRWVSSAGVHCLVPAARDQPLCLGWRLFPSL